MEVSVIIPTYKPESYLWECLESLRNQTLDKAKFEIIIVLNGCCEPWKQNIQAYIKNQLDGYNIVFRQTDTPGVSNARNMALDLANGDYILFIDDDDFISSTTLELLLKKVDGESVILFKPLAFYDHTHNYFSYSLTDEYTKNAITQQLDFKKARKYFGGPVMKLFPRDIIGNRRFDIAFSNGEDSIFMFLISDRLTTVKFADPDAIYYRRIRENSAVTKKKFFFPVLLNSLKASCVFTRIFFSNFGNYNFYFYLTRMMGAVKALIYYRKLTY